MTMDDLPLTLCIEVTPSQMLAFAQFLKRVGWSHYRVLACDDEEAYAMQAVSERLRLVLALQGFTPR